MSEPYITIDISDLLSSFQPMIDVFGPVFAIGFAVTILAGLSAMISWRFLNRKGR